MPRQPPLLVRAIALLACAWAPGSRSRADGGGLAKRDVRVSILPTSPRTIAARRTTKSIQIDRSTNAGPQGAMMELPEQPAMFPDRWRQKETAHPEGFGAETITKGHSRMLLCRRAHPPTAPPGMPPTVKPFG
jgi:hypothetical protein